MRNLTATICLTLTILLGSVGVSASADFQKGVTAFKSGDYATALREWTPLAEQGLADAQGALSAMYVRGWGVIKDWVYAHMWGNLAASNGSEDGVKSRDIAATSMTPAKIAEAQKLARECARKNCKGC